MSTSADQLIAAVKDARSAGDFGDEYISWSADWLLEAKTLAQPVTSVMSTSADQLIAAGKDFA